MQFSQGEEVRLERMSRKWGKVLRCLRSSAFTLFKMGGEGLSFVVGSEELGVRAGPSKT